LAPGDEILHGDGELSVSAEAARNRSADTERVFEAYRRWGYLSADLDPLGFLAPIGHPELPTEGEDAAAARKF
jgi:2-oxoglutarate dehydrogenase complex dehydrogenase (E1) component-like enzyme